MEVPILWWGRSEHMEQEWKPVAAETIVLKMYCRGTKHWPSVEQNVSTHKNLRFLLAWVAKRSMSGLPPSWKASHQDFRPNSPNVSDFHTQTSSRWCKGGRTPPFLSLCHITVVHHSMCEWPFREQAAAFPCTLARRVQRHRYPCTFLALSQVTLPMPWRTCPEWTFLVAKEHLSINTWAAQLLAEKVTGLKP